MKYIILGAGPSGLALANALLDKGCAHRDLLVIEKQSVAGGLCRSEIVDDAPLDTGGGHFLDLKRQDVLTFLFRFMPSEEWQRFDRISKIRIRNLEIDHPLEANLWQFPKDVQVDYLESIAQAGCVRGTKMPASFEEWIKWKFGECIAREYMLPYNRKIWSMDLNQLGTYWLYKLPNVAFRETLLSCLEGKPMGTLPAHGTFLYPKEFGYGEVWRRMGEALGSSLATDCAVEAIDCRTRTVNGRWQAETIISTIPWTLWPDFCELPETIATAISQLKYTSIDVDYQPDGIESTAHWIYDPDEHTAHHRILVRSNFCIGAAGCWTETNALRSPAYSGIRFHNRFAYPVNTLKKPQIINQILAWARSQGIIGLGRWGRWEHMNSDIAVAEALEMANRLKA